ncbi:MAG: hypothetical protein E7534_04205 [Ruminococcaceae bacterium]|nr:hypothetical protein [Oscillospiraceae bacterium]
MEKVKLAHHDILIDGLQQTYRILHASDNHLHMIDDAVPPACAAYAAPREVEFTTDGVMTVPRFEALCDYIEEHKDELDAVVFTGDVTDFPSDSSIAYIKQKLAALPIPYIFTLGNHDWSYFNEYHTAYAKEVERPKFADLCDGNTDVHKVKVGELTFVAVDNTCGYYEDGVAEQLDAALAGETNAIICQHIPLFCPTLHEDEVKRWKRDLTIGSLLGRHNDNWQKVMCSITRSGSPVKAVFCGDSHFPHIDVLTDGVTQYMAPLGSAGYYHHYTIHG